MGQYPVAPISSDTYRAVPGSARIAKPYVLRLLKEEGADDKMGMRNHQLMGLTEAIARDGAPFEAQGILDVMDREDTAWPQAASAIVRATAALGPDYYHEAERFAQRTATERMSSANPAALAIGSCRYLSVEWVRAGLAGVDYPAAKAEALCEIALTTGRGEYLQDAASVARSMTDRFGGVNAAVTKFIHIIDSAGVMHGRPVKPGSSSESFVHRWAFPSRD
jgi:hypothetical protein